MSRQTGDYWRRLRADTDDGRLGRRRLLAGAGIGAAALLAAACGGDEKASDEASTTQPASGGASGSSATPVAAGDPKRGGRARVYIPVDVTVLDPHLSSIGSDDHYMWPIYDSLVTYSLKDFSPVPQLAERWEVSPDNATYTFKLRQNVKFHDGTDFNAEAVRFNFARMLAPDIASPTGARLRPILDSYTAVDPTTFQVKLKEPFAPFLSYLYGTANQRGGQVVSPRAAERLGKDLTREPVGTGPFTFKSRVTGSEVVFERFPEYWDRGKPYLDGATARYFADSTVAWEETRSGGNDMGYVSTQDLEQARKESKLQVVGGTVPTAIGHLILNSVKAPFSDVRARRALSLATDRKALVDTTQEGHGEAMSAFVPAKDWSFNPNAKYFRTDMAEAKRLMAAAGVAPGTRVRMISFQFTPMASRAEALQAQFRELGLNVEIEQGEIAPMVAQLRAGNYDIANFTWDYPGDPHYYFDNFYNMELQRAQNFHIRLPVENPAYARINDLRRQAQQVADQQQRQKLYFEAQDVMNQELFYVPTTQIAAFFAQRKNLGPADFPADGKPHFERLYNT